MGIFGDPNGTRTRVFGVRGRCPRPLDDGTTHIINYRLELKVNHGIRVVKVFFGWKVRLNPGIWQ